MEGPSRAAESREARETSIPLTETLLLDTDTCIAILRGRPSGPAERIAESVPSQIRVSAIVRAELVFGAHHSKAPAQNLRLVDEFLSPLSCVPFDEKCADEYGVLREDLARRRQIIGPNDMLIAATALAHGLTLVTHNTDEFSRVVDLKLIDWLARR